MAIIDPTPYAQRVEFYRARGEDYGTASAYAAADVAAADAAAEQRGARQPKLVTAERAREILDAGGSVHRDDRYSGDYRYLVDSMGTTPTSRKDDAHIPGTP